MFLATIGLVSLAASTLGADIPMKSSALPADLRQNLILYYDFDTEPFAGQIADKSAHRNDGVVVNVQFVKNGHQGGAANFGLNKSYITVPNKDELNPPLLTLAAWIKTSYSDWVWRRIFDKGTGKGYDLTMGGDDKGNPKWRGHVGLEAGPTWAGSGQPVTDGQWHHVVGTFDGVESRIYVDARLVGKPQMWNNHLPSTPYNLTIGANRSNPNAALGEVDASFNGMMDDMMMFNRALSADEVQALFKSQGGVPATQPAQPPRPTGTQSKPGAADRLKQVKQLFEQGLINKEDYDRKVKEIMDSI